ncbi:MAG: carboxypeptidase Q [Pseudohongiellaceae bacterium]|jgi:carboxypeptidase Q
MALFSTLFLTRCARSLAAVIVSTAASSALTTAASVPEDTSAPAITSAVADVQARAAQVELILKEALTRGRAMERLTDLCTRAPHRLAGSPGYMAAAEWARQTMEEDGLSNVRFEWTDAPRWERGSVGKVALIEPSAHQAELPMLALGGSIATPEHGLTAEVVVVESLAEAAELGIKAHGKIVLFNRPLDGSLVNTFSAYGGAVSQRSQGARAAAKVGAVAALVRSMTTRIDDVPHTGGMRYANDVTKIPTAAISTLAAEKIASLVAAGQRVVLHFEQNCRTMPDAPNPNVVGDWLGHERPDEIIVVGGHLDCWDVGQGAHDDGGGCCQALEAVRLLKTLGLHPRRTLRVVLFANEENGLAGGKAYIGHHRDELSKHILALESDSGVFTPRGFTTDANPEARAILDAIAKLLSAAGAGRMTTGHGGADIGPLAAHGTVLVGYDPDPQRYFDLHHSARDTLAAVNEREINLGAGVIAALIWIVADLELTLPRNPITADN